MRKNVFSNVAEREPKTAAAPPSVADTPQSYPKHRQGKKALIAYFSPAVSKALRQMALDEDSTMQSLLGEAIDLLMRDRGKHPFGER
ncbi:ribbon-helix-helix domain-containing protein [Novosphingopyxis sp.]|uniref:ribbon-helix-helix domain-containing protein n=1 Tax=Novosphingopyxis sp. TaxID=2709690 RepID=UPI003B5A7580